MNNWNFLLKSRIFFDRSRYGLCRTVLTGLLCAAAFAATAQTTLNGVQYLDENGDIQSKDGVTVLTVAELGGGAGNTLAAGWYLISGTIGTTSITINATDVHLILENGCSLTITITSGDDPGIRVEGANSLTVYAQSNDATRGRIEVSTDNGAGIGGSGAPGMGNATSGGTVTITGGTVTASSTNATGIGGGLSNYYFSIGTPATIILPGYYNFWTNTAPTDPGGVPINYPASTAYTHSNTYKFVKIETHVPVSGITGIPATATTGTPLTLTGTVNPANASYQNIEWNVENAGTTGANFTSNVLNTTSPGTVTVRAKIVNGAAFGTTYWQDFIITVGAPPTPATVPHITGPQWLTLVTGYAATSTGAYTITGTSPVTVAKASGNADITWNGTTKRFDIAAGLPVGEYPVVLCASNSAGSHSFTFTLTVENPVYYIDNPVTFTGGTVESSPLYLAEAGQTVTLTVSPDAGYQLESLTVTGYGDPNVTVALTGTGATHTFRMPAHHVTIVAVFRVATSNAELTIDNGQLTIKTWISNGTLNISGLKAGETFNVYNITGTLIYQAPSNSPQGGGFTPLLEGTGEASLLLPARGIYIVRSGNKAIKVSY